MLNILYGDIEVVILEGEGKNIVRHYDVLLEINKVTM